MIADLMNRLKEVEGIIRNSDYYLEDRTRVESFSKQDNEIFEKWLKKDVEDRPYMSRYMDYPLIGVNKKFRKNSQKYIIKDLKKRDEELKKSSARLKNRSLFDGVKNETVKELKLGPDLEYLHNEVSYLYYETVVFKVKKLAKKDNVKPLYFVTNKDGRNRILKEIFDTKDKYDKFNNVFTDSKTENLILCNEYLSTSVNIESNHSIPLLGRYFKYKISKYPSNSVINNFIREEKEYNKRRADDIYDTPKEKKHVMNDIFK
jgi:hypothetical protein